MKVYKAKCSLKFLYLYFNVDYKGGTVAKWSKALL